MGRPNVSDENRKAALDATQLLFKYLQKENRLTEDFVVYGLRQVRPLYMSPSAELYKAIRQWPQWVRKYIDLN